MRTDPRTSRAEAARAPAPCPFVDVVERCWDPVLRFFWLRAGPDAAQDLAQRVFLNAHRLRRDGGGPTGAPEDWEPYLLRSARNLWIDERRRRGTQPEQASLEALLEDTEGEAAARPGESGPQRLLTVELREALVQCLQELDTLARSLCWAHFVHGASVRRIARALSRPESTLRLVLTRALASLRACLTRKDLAPEEAS